jgi:cell division transport system permease protein
MLARITYALRETWASFKRNVTLSAASIVTAAVALLLAGSTLLIQKAFSNLLVQWQGGVEMIVFMKAGSTPEQVATVTQAVKDAGVAAPAGVTYLDQAKTFEQAKIVLAGQKTYLDSLNAQNIYSEIRVAPLKGQQDRLPDLKKQLETEPSVSQVGLAEENLLIYRRLSGFVRGVTIVLSTVLLFVAVLLIWNTIRTAMFARRREIEVMKLVGATNWFIRIPFMLEGLLQGLIGSVVSCVGLYAANSLWTKNLNGIAHDTKSASTITLLALRVNNGYLQGIMIIVVIIGMAAGAIGAGVAASRFLDV